MSGSAHTTQTAGQGVNLWKGGASRFQGQALVQHIGSTSWKGELETDYRSF
jgi:hypothetical protein